MEKDKNKSIINPELYDKLKKDKFKIHKDYNFRVRKRPTCREFFKLLLRWLRNKFLGFRN